MKIKCRRSASIALWMLMGSSQSWSTAQGQVPSALTGDIPISVSGYAPVIAHRADGSFVVVWTTESDVYFRTVSADGVPVGTAVLVSTGPEIFNFYPSVAAGANGSFVVAWWAGDMNGGTVMRQLFDENANPVGPNLRVPSTLTGSQSATIRGGAVAIDSALDFLIVWTDDAEPDVRVRRFSGVDSTAIGPEQEASEQGFAYGESISISADSALATWFAFGDGSNAGIYARLLSPTGIPSGPEFRVNEITVGDQRRSATGPGKDEDFLVAWADGSPFSSGRQQIFARRVSSAGALVGGEFQVSSLPADTRQYPSVLGDPHGGYIVAWANYSTGGGSADVYGRQLAFDGRTIGPDFPVSEADAGDQQDVSVAGAACGRFMAVWGADGSGILGRLFRGSCVFLDGFDSGTHLGWSSANP